MIVLVYYSVVMDEPLRILCPGCDTMLPPESFAIDKMRRTGRRYKCRKCSAEEFKRWQRTPGYVTRLNKQKALRLELKKTDPRQRWARVAADASRARAKQKGISHSITWPWILEMCPDVCPLLGIPLVYNNDTSQTNSASLDQIDRSRGYEPDNCWVISMMANRIKSNATLEQIEMVGNNLRRALTERGFLSNTPADSLPPPAKRRANPYDR